MLGWVILFLVLAAIAAIFGFGGLVSAFTSIALILFWIFVALLVISIIMSLIRRST